MKLLKPGRMLTLCACICLVAAFTLRTSEGAEPKDGKAKTKKTKKADPKKAAKKKADRREALRQLMLFADTLDQIERNYVKGKKISRKELIEAAIQGMLKKLDQYSDYVPPSETDRFRSGVESQFGGIGIQIDVVRGQLTIISPIVGTPAYRAGIRAGDRIIRIGGKSTKGFNTAQAVKLLKGKIGTSVTFTVVHVDSPKEVKVTVKRALVKVNTVLGDSRNKDDSWDFMLRKDSGIGYIRITSFSRRTPTELRKAMTQLKKQEVKGLILDLRFNPGGLLPAAIEISDMFLSEGKIVSTSGANVRTRVWNAKKPGTFDKFPMAVLVNRYSASASEIVSACLQDHERAIIIGERTWGKGSVQNIIPLDGGRSLLKLTTASYHRPSGKNIHRFKGATAKDEWGVTPEGDFRIRLTDGELNALLLQRRNRDVVRSTDAPAKANVVDRQLAKAINQLHKELGVKIDKPKKKKSKKKPAKKKPAKKTKK